MNTQGSQDARQREKFWQGRSYTTRKELVMDETKFRLQAGIKIANEEITRLESLNAELVEALQFCENVLSGHPLKSSEAKAWQVAYDTLAKARGES